MKKVRKHIIIATIIILFASVAIFISKFEQIDLIGWGDPIVLTEELVSKDGQSGIWTGEYDHHLDCGDCMVKNRYLLNIVSYDSSAFLIEAWSDYENIFQVPVFDLRYGRIKNSNHFFSSVYEFRGNCLVRMAKNQDEAREVSPPRFEHYSENGCKLKTDDYPVRSYKMERHDETLILTRFR